MSATFSCPVSTYQQFTPQDGDGWQRRTLEFSAEHTAFVVMHAWDPPAGDNLPGWQRAVPYLREVTSIVQDTFPSLREAARLRGLPVFHVTGNIPPEDQPPLDVPVDPTWSALHAFRQDHVFPGADNLRDVAAGRASRRLATAAEPASDESTAETSAELHRHCQTHGINHLIYLGFAINWCLLMSPGGMVDMKRHGYLCSTVAEATTAVENEITAPHRIEYHQALWRVAVEFGFVFNHRDLIEALTKTAPPPLS